jgi:hypothetical protein
MMMIMRNMFSSRKGPARRGFLAGLILLATVALAPMSAMADDSTPKDYDGRLDGYPKNVTLDGGTSLTYFLFVGLGVIGIGVLFKNPNRTHLD